MRMSRAEGGALETVLPGRTGVLVTGAGPQALAEGLRQAVDARFDAAAIRHHAERFSRERFAAEITAVIEQSLNGRGEPGW